jgi:hypothetical protein
MKDILFFSFLVAVLLSCSSADKKIFIKSEKSGSSIRVDWYFYSLPSNFSRSYIQLSKADNESKVFESFYISDFNLKGDTLSVQLYRNDFEVDSVLLKKNGFNISVDTTGSIWNQASSRLGRLQRKNVDYFKPHIEDSYCPENECY